MKRGTYKNIKKEKTEKTSQSSLEASLLSTNTERFFNQGNY